MVNYINWPYFCLIIISLKFNLVINKNILIKKKVVISFIKLLFIISDSKLLKVLNG